MRHPNCPRNDVRLIAPLLFLFSIAAAQAGESLPQADPADVGMSAERLERLTSAMQEYVDDGRLPGAVVTVTRQGRVAYQEAFGHRDIESSAPMQTDSIFRIASQTKAIISVGIMMLQEDGALLIGDRVSRFLPEFKETTVAIANEDDGYDVVSANREITIRDLLTHTAGVDYGTGIAADRWEDAEITGWYFAHRDEPVADTVARIAALPFSAHPGERYIYGYSTDILGAVIEAASGQSLDVFLKRRIFDPLGMADTHFYLPTSKRDRLAVVYMYEDGSLKRAPSPGRMVGQGAYVDGPRKSFSGGAGLLSTANDYTRFLQAMLNGGILDGQRILSRKSVELMTVNHTGDLFPRFFGGGTGFGLGFFVVLDVGERGVPGSWGEYGWGGAYATTYWVDPEEDMVVTYMTQVLPAPDREDHSRLRAMVYQAIID